MGRFNSRRNLGGLDAVFFAAIQTGNINDSCFLLAGDFRFYGRRNCCSFGLQGNFMTARFATRAGDALGDGPGFDLKLLAAVLTADLHHIGWRFGRCLRSDRYFFPLPAWPKRDGIPAGLAARTADMGGNLVRIHSIDFFAF